MIQRTTQERRQHVKKIHQVLLALAIVVVGLGAYTRLKHAGLGCPDWPKCYQNWLVHPNITMPALSHDATQKAWIEMIHRYVAGFLGLGIFVLRQYYAALKVNCTRLTITLSIVLLQAIFGMWTVTWRLHPMAVMPHLIGGMTISTLLYLDYDKKYKPIRSTTYTAKISGKLKALWALCLTQIIIGGWTSANYAALVCPDFPMCQGRWSAPIQHIVQGFTLPFGHITYEGGVLSGEARIAIHIVHRLGAFLCTLMLVHLSYAVFKIHQRLSRPFLLRFLAIIITFFLQVALGIANVVWQLPIVTAVGHNLVALILLIQITQLIAQATHNPQPAHDFQNAQQLTYAQ